MFKTDWVVYLKETFESSSSVIEYLARYTHRIAISNYRIVRCKDGKVTFVWKDYADGNKKKLMTLDVLEFMKRFLLHVVPKRFVRIRYYGLLSNRSKKAEIQRCLEYYGISFASERTEKTWADLYLEVTGTDVRICPKCRAGTMVVTEVIPDKRGSPEMAA